MSTLERQTPLQPPGRIELLSWLFEIAGLVILVVYAGWWITAGLMLTIGGHNLSYHYRQKRSDQRKDGWA